MTGATDLITYIGVPLTVAGVLPLLWNMILGIHIWLKLKKSIPLRYRAYYSLLPDPAAGKVTVVAHIPSLELPGLWSTKPGRNDLGKVWSPKRIPTLPTLADHVAFIPITPALPVVNTSRLLANDDSTIIPTYSFNVARQRLLGRTWMTLADRCDLVLGSPQDDENAYGTRLEHEDDDEEVRFICESDMNANVPTPLRMNWAQFVWLSLALGVRPRDSAWNEDYPFTLKDSEGNALITLSESDALTEQTEGRSARNRLRALLREKDSAYEVEKLERRLSLALDQLTIFIADCNELNTLTVNKVSASKRTDIYELLPRRHRARLEDAVQAKSLPSSTLKSNQLDGISLVASVALATAEWDTVIHQAWRLNVEATSRIEYATSRWRESRDRFRSFYDNKEKYISSRRRFHLDSFDTELAALLDDGLYKAPESSELDALLKKKIRKVSLL